MSSVFSTGKSSRNSVQDVLEHRDSYRQLFKKKKRLMSESDEDAHDRQKNRLTCYSHVIVSLLTEIMTFQFAYLFNQHSWLVKNKPAVCRAARLWQKSQS